MAQDLHQETMKQYSAILDALEELTLLHGDADEEEEEEKDESDASDHDDVDTMVESAAERGMDEEGVEKVFRAVESLIKKAKEG